MCKKRLTHNYKTGLLLLLFLLNSYFSIAQGPVYHFKEGEALSLSGQWKFKFAPTISQLDSVQYQLYDASESSWISFNDKFTRVGACAYQCTIINPDKAQLGVLFPFIVLDYEIYANDELIYRTKHYDPENVPSGTPARIRSFFKLPLSDTIKITAKVKNAITHEPGILLPPLVDHYSKLYLKEEKRQIFEYAGIGILFIMALYHFVLYFFIDSRSALWLGLVSLIICIRATVVYDGTFILYQLFPALDFSLAKRFEYSFLYLAPIFSALFFRDQFLVKKYDQIFQLVGVACIIMALLVWFIPVHYFETSVDILHIISVIVLFITFDILRIAIINKIRTAKIVLIGYIIPTILVILEILKTDSIIYIDMGPNMLNTAMVIYILVQAVAVSAQIAAVYQENKFLNQNLEKSVEQKTIELSESNSTKSHILSVLSHDLMNPLNNLKGALNLLNKDFLTPQELSKMKEDFTSQINHNIKLMEEVLSWSSVELKKQRSNEHMKSCNLKMAGETVCKQLKQQALDKRIKLKNEIPPATMAEIDPDAAVIILRNLIGNAIKFTHATGTVKIKAHVNNGHVKVGILDNGIGIPDDMKTKIFSPETAGTRYGTDNEKGKGVGLLIVKDLVTQHAGKIWIEDNSESTGTAFFFQLNHLKSN